MCCQYGNGTVKSEFFSYTGFENRIIKRMIAGNRNDNIDIFIVNKLFDGFMKIECGDKVKLRIKFFKLFIQPVSFFFQFFV